MFFLCCKKMQQVCIFLAVVLFVLTLPAQADTGRNQKHCLWRVSSAKNTVYILGSIHLLKKENYPLPEAFESAFQEAEIVVLELNPDSLSPVRMQALALAKGMYASGKTLQTGLSAETYKLAEERMREMGMSLALFNNFEPWLVGITVTVMKLQQLGLDPNLGVDKYFFDKAKRDQKKVLSFETAEYQLDRVDGLSPKLQEAFLLQTLKDWELIAKELDELVQAWSMGEEQSLEAKLLESFKEFPEIYLKLVTERNHNWLPQIEAFLRQEHDYLIVVGVGHLIGKDSVLQLLQAKGYQIQKL